MVLPFFTLSTKSFFVGFILLLWAKLKIFGWFQIVFITYKCVCVYLRQYSYSSILLLNKQQEKNHFSFSHHSGPKYVTSKPRVPNCLNVPQQSLNKKFIVLTLMNELHAHKRQQVGSPSYGFHVLAETLLTLLYG